MEDIGDDLHGARGAADYALRTTQQTLVHLAAMADQKASIVLGSSFVMATIVFGDVAGSAELDFVRVSLLVTAVLSGVLAAVALALRRSMSPEPHRQPLFFGSIAQMDADEYETLMKGIIADTDRIHESIVRDIHAASGVLLTSKFRPLQWSYAVLVVGMLVTLVGALVT